MIKKNKKISPSIGEGGGEQRAAAGVVRMPFRKVFAMTQAPSCLRMQVTRGSGGERDAHTVPLSSPGSGNAETGLRLVAMGRPSERRK